MTERVSSVVHDVVDAFNGDDLENMLNRTTPDFEVDFTRASGPGGGSYTADDWVRFLADWKKTWTSSHIELHETIEKGPTS